MKQKISNRILSICNILVWIIFWSLDFWGNEYQFGVKIEHSVFSIYEQYQAIISSFKVLFIMLVVINLIFIIQNRKNRKLMLWYIVPTIFYIICTLKIFEIDISNTFLSKAWCIIPTIILLINLIIEITRKKRKKRMILYVLGIIMCIIMFFTNKYNDMIWFVIATIMQFIYSKELVEERKIQKVINIISFIILGIVIIYITTKYAIMLTDLYEIDKKSAEFINQIEIGLEQESTNTTNTLIRVCKNNKWGCINQEGEEIIPCEYDYIGENEYEHVSNIIYKARYFIAKKDETYYVLSMSGKVLATNKEVPIPFFKGQIMEVAMHGIEDTKTIENSILFSAQTLLSNYLKKDYAEEIFQENDNNEIQPSNSYYNDDFNYVYEYQLQNGYELEIEEIVEYEEQGDQYKYNIKVKKNNEIINTYENVGLIIDQYGDLGSIKTYTNGNIPYYKLEEKLQGYYSKDNLTAITLKGDYEILDTIDDKIIVRDYNDISNIKEMIANTSGNILVMAKEINATENGYIVKKENNKMIYMNNNLEEKTQEFDFISSHYLTHGLLICANNTESGKEYILCNLNGDMLSLQSYQIIEEDYSVEESAYNRSYLLDSIYEEYYALLYN